jgi:hypothetical protein
MKVLNDEAAVVSDAASVVNVMNGPPAPGRAPASIQALSKYPKFPGALRCVAARGKHGRRADPRSPYPLAAVS